MISEKNRLPAGRVREAAARGTLSHAWLITGAGDRMELARYTAAAMECEAEGGKPCGVCRACRKVLEDIHPDVVTVRDPEHKNIAVEIVRDVRTDAYIRPNEGRRKVYIFPDCSILPEQGQNVLLKIVEEGPPYAAFLFCAENRAQVLQTLRSRCVEIKLQGGEAGTAEIPEDAAALCRAVASRRRGCAAELLTAVERKKPDRSAVAELLAGSYALFAAALELQYGQQDAHADREIVPVLAKNLTKTQIMSTIEVLQKYHGECVYNVGTGHLLGALAAELEGIL